MSKKPKSKPKSPVNDQTAKQVQKQAQKQGKSRAKANATAQSHWRKAGTALAIHGGAGPELGREYRAERLQLTQTILNGRDALLDGVCALDVVTMMVKALEASGLYAAGKGTAPNTDGVFEMDASIMDGATRKAGAVAALSGYKSAVDIARGVMERTPHVMLAGAGAAQFALAHNYADIPNPHDYFTPTAPQTPVDPGALAHGTVGAVARDAAGNLAAATSTGGVFFKLPGRVGDTPLIGAGTWADKRVAVSCTGQGEYFIRAAVAADVSARMVYGGQSLKKATKGALADMAAQGGEGGLIAVDSAGRIALPFTSPALKRAWITKNGEGRAQAY